MASSMQLNFQILKYLHKNRFSYENVVICCWTDDIHDLEENTPRSEGDAVWNISYNDESR